MKDTVKKFPFLSGNRVALRQIELSDATAEYAGWLNDPETTRYLESGEAEENTESVRNYISRYQGREDALLLAIMLSSSKLHVGNLKFEPISHRHRRAEMGIMIGSKDARGIGIGTEAIRLALEYAFNELGLNRVSLGVRSDNLEAINCYKKIGFLIEGSSREAIWTGDRYVDSISMGILAEEFRKQIGCLT